MTSRFWLAFSNEVELLQPLLTQRESVNLALRLLALLSRPEVVAHQAVMTAGPDGNSVGGAANLTDSGATNMSRPIWKGHISFGLVNVPVVLNAAERKAGDLSFRMIDSRNSARVRYERVNEETGEEVPWDKIVKGYEYEDGNYVLMSEEELEHASPEMTRTIEIEQFVDLEDIDVRYFERPYVLVPGNKGEKGYVLLREAIRRSRQGGHRPCRDSRSAVSRGTYSPGGRPGTRIAPIRSRTYRLERFRTAFQRFAAKRRFA